MKEVVALLGSKRKKNTYQLLNEIKNILQKNGIRLEIMELYQYHVEPCVGCYHCVLCDKCVLQDDAQYIMKRLSEADGIILASPVYLKQISGSLKVFLDRTCKWYHRPVLTEKPVLSVATTKGSGLKATLSYLESIAVQWGAVPAGAVGRTIFTQGKHVSEKEISKFIELLNHPCSYSPSFYELLNFEIQKSMALSINQLDREYWNKKQWQDMPYFYSCKINIVYQLISSTVGKFIRYKMKDADK